MADIPQSYANHRRIDPWYHVFLFGVLAINVVVALVRLVRYPGLPMAWSVVVSVALVVLLFKVRLYALKVQDRVIRLEERLRLSVLLPEPLRARIPELTLGQLVALRFASDAEVPGLVERALAGAL